MECIVDCNKALNIRWPTANISAPYSLRSRDVIACDYCQSLITVLVLKPSTFVIWPDNQPDKQVGLWLSPAAVVVESCLFVTPASWLCCGEIPVAVT